AAPVNSDPGGVLRGALFRRGTAGRFQNLIVEDFGTATAVFQDPTTPPHQLTCPVLSNVTCNNSSTVTSTATCPLPACDVANTIPDMAYPTVVDARYVVNPSIATTQDCAALPGNTFFQSAPYRGAFDNANNWLQDALHPACPAGDPFNTTVVPGKRCWVSFDLH